MSLFSRARRRFVFAAVTLTLLLSGAFLPPSGGGHTLVVSSALAGTSYRYSKEIRYYSDATYTNQVGTGMIYCNGTGTLDGQSTAYRQEDIIDICCRDPGGNSWVPC